MLNIMDHFEDRFYCIVSILVNNKFDFETM